MQFDLFVPRRGWLHRLDPRTKFLLTLDGLVVSLLFQDFVVLGGVLVVYHLLLLSAGIPWKQLRWLWVRMLPLTIMILVLQPFFASGVDDQVLWQWGPLRWTAGGVLSGAVFALRVNGMAFVVAGLLFTTEPTLLVRGLVRLGLPYEWGLTVSLAIRYLPTTYGLYQSIYEAQQARGWDPTQGSFLRRVRNYVPMLVAVMIAALRMADNLGMALAARGFGAQRGVQRTTLRDIWFRPIDWAVTAGLAVVLVSSLILKIG
jgi:energy-coupling factor transport system permease protein